MAKAFSRPTWRVMQLIEVLADAPPEGIGFNNLCETLDINRMTCSGMLQSASSLGYLSQTKKGRKWVLGPKLVALASSMERTEPLR